MGTAKKERSRVEREGRVKGDPKTKGENFYRSAKKVKQLNTLTGGNAVRNKEGKIVQAAAFQSRQAPTAVIEPNRRWFTNTRVIAQDTLTSFRDAMAEKAKDPYTVLLKSNKLPMSLIRDEAKPMDGIRKHASKMTIESEPFGLTFGPKAQRKRPKLSFASVDDLAAETDKSLDTYTARVEELKILNGAAGTTTAHGEGEGVVVEEEYSIATAKEAIFTKGQSKRIWNELYKVIDSSDVLLVVLDARDPEGTRCRHVEKYVKAECPHKHIVFVLNKIDLVPSNTAAAWIKSLQRDYPTCAMRSNLKNPFGRGSLIDLLRQFSILHKDRKQVSVGLIGYPNVGKSSVINCLRSKKVAVVAPIPGETKIWQYITLMKRIYLIDCPGIVPPNNKDTPEDLLLRGVVRVENIDNPEQYIPAVLRRVKTHHMERTYELPMVGADGKVIDHITFLEILCRKAGRLLKGGEPDVDGVAKMVLNDFMRGKIPWYTPAPAMVGADGVVIEGREGRYGEMPAKRKREEEETVMDDSIAPSATEGDEEEASEDEDDVEDEDFGGFSSDSDSEVEAGAEEEADGAEDMIPLDDTSDEEDGDDASEAGDKAEKPAGMAIEGASDVADSDEEVAEAAPAQKRRKRTR
ncbi:NUC091 domain-containing protein [Podospora appendiculata]|uniref:Nucleolar GTP-binding protein 2 n=1 Tax=Podospora appendiculata TaxID=314037 RepID=A0AAE1CHH8_9PEZI|nr:NUC091 domain-containing protein [Podospora appendiculata]